VNETDVRIKVDEDNFIISVETEKLLGIYIDKTLSWEVQIDKLCTIIASRLHINKHKHFGEQGVNHL
jgi:hypothetical protein